MHVCNYTNLLQIHGLLYCFQIDILVNNAGRSQRAMAIDTSNEVEKHLMEINVLSVMSLTKTVLPYMIRNGGGHIVVNSSLAGKTGMMTKQLIRDRSFCLQILTLT